MTDQTKKGWLLPIITSIITSLAVMAGAWFSLQGTVESSSLTAESKRLEIAFQRIEYLETQMKQQQVTSNTKIIELTTQVFKLQSQLNKDLNIRDMFESFMEGLPFEAWLKKVEVADDGEVSFEMVYINKQYEFTFGVSQQRYSGSEDSDVWDNQISAEFNQNDLKAFREKSAILTYELYPDKVSEAGTPQQYSKNLVMKMYVELIEGEPLIFGMALNLDEDRIIK